MTDDTTDAWLDRWTGDDALDRPGHWRARAEVRERLETAWPGATENGDATVLPARAQALLQRLEKADAALHRRLRTAVRAGCGPNVFRRWRAGASASAQRAHEGDGYDALDDLVAGVLRLPDPGAELLPLAPGMVFYQPTPVRHVLDMLDRAGLGPGDVLVDLGSGLGQVPMLAAICTGARAVGVELQPAYVACARQAARALELRGVRFCAQDARAADLSEATVFFLYTPFRGAVLRTMLDALCAEAGRRPIRLCTFGPCTRDVAAEPWLRTDEPVAVDRVAVFYAR